MAMAETATATEELLRQTGCAVECEVELGPLTWYTLGGRAQFIAHPHNSEQLSQLLRLCTKLSIPARVLGKGANLLICEGLLLGVTIRLDSMNSVHLDAESGRVIAGGGADLEQLITATVRAGLAGLEVLAGIPATIGGALKMNAGGAFGSIGPCVHRVTAVEPDGRLVELSREQLHFSYRKSNLGERIVAEAEFALTPVADQPALRQRLKEVMKYKKDSQPMAASSAGCAFKNPPKEISEKGAGKLIDEAGLKGFRIGGAEVSPVHANFIVLHDGGKAHDVLEVMRHVERVVREKFSITLEREVVVWNGV